jgi:hypothetical protein
VIRREIMKSIKYFGIYTGPSYGGYSEVEQLPGFFSTEHAMRYFRDFQAGQVYSNEYMMNNDVEYVLWETDALSNTPATTEGDSMDIYAAIKTSRGTYQRADYPYARLYLGERGGVRIEWY